jgi:hypothetical protein
VPWGSDSIVVYYVGNRGAIGLWSKVVYYIGNRVAFGTQTWFTFPCLDIACTNQAEEVSWSGVAILLEQRRSAVQVWPSDWSRGGQLFRCSHPIGAEEVRCGHPIGAGEVSWSGVAILLEQGRSDVTKVEFQTQIGNARSNAGLDRTTPLVLIKNDWIRGLEGK